MVDAENRDKWEDAQQVSGTGHGRVAPGQPGYPHRGDRSRRLRSWSLARRSRLALCT